MRRILLLLTILISSPAYATTYCVSPSGSDSNTGISAIGDCSESTWWQTVHKVNTFTGFSPDDVIKFKAGNTYTTRLFPSGDSGTSGHPITFTRYGTGTNPLFDDSAATLTNISAYPMDYLTFISIDAVIPNSNNSPAVNLKDCTDCTFDDVNITNPYGRTTRAAGYEAINSPNFLIKNGEVSNALYLIYISPTANGSGTYGTAGVPATPFSGRVTNMYLHDADKSTQADWDCIKINGRINWAGLIQIDHNEMTMWGEDGIDALFSRGLLIEYNYFHGPLNTLNTLTGNNAVHALKIIGQGGSIIRYNLFENLRTVNNLEGDCIFNSIPTGFNTVGSGPNQFYGNVCINSLKYPINHNASQELGTPDQIYDNTFHSPESVNSFVQLGGNAEFRNNIISTVNVEVKLIAPPAISEFTTADTVTITGGYNIFAQDTAVLNAAPTVSFYNGDSDDLYATNPRWVNPITTSNVTKPRTVTVTNATDTFTLSGHTVVNGDRITFCNDLAISPDTSTVACTTMPTGLTYTDVYYAVNVSGDDFKVSLTEGGTAVDITTDGTAVQYMDWTYASYDYQLNTGTPSPAINAGTTGLGTVDIEDVPLPQEGVWDIGAYESGYVSPSEAGNTTVGSILKATELRGARRG